MHLFLLASIPLPVITLKFLLFLLVRHLLLVAMHLFLLASIPLPVITLKFLLFLLVRHLLLVAMHLFLLASIPLPVITLKFLLFLLYSKAPVTSSDALVPTSFDSFASNYT